jgi:hypothetical protein
MATILKTIVLMYEFEYLKLLYLERSGWSEQQL